MYLVKQLVLFEDSNNMYCIDGIYADPQEETIMNPFFGTATIEKYISKNCSSNISRRFCNIEYISNYKVKNIGNGYINLSIFIDECKKEEIEGFIIFVERASDIITNGKKIFCRLPTQAVVLLKEGEFIICNNTKVEVNNNKLEFLHYSS